MKKYSLTISFKVFVIIQFIIGIFIFYYLDYLAQTNPDSGISLTDGLSTTLSEVFTTKFLFLLVAFFLQLYAISKYLTHPYKIEHAIPAGLLIVLVCGINYLMFYMVAGSPYRIITQSLTG